MHEENVRDRTDASLRERFLDRFTAIQNAPYALFNDITLVSASKEEIRTRMPVTSDKMNSLGFVHGAAIFAIADCTFAYAANLSDDIQIAISASILYHKPGVGKELTASSTPVSETNSLSAHNVRIFCDGKHIATAVFSGFKMKDRKDRDTASAARTQDSMP